MDIIRLWVDETEDDEEGMIPYLVRKGIIVPDCCEEAQYGHIYLSYRTHAIPGFEKLTQQEIFRTIKPWWMVWPPELNFVVPPGKMGDYEYHKKVMHFRASHCPFCGTELPEIVPRAEAMQPVPLHDCNEDGGYCLTCGERSGWGCQCFSPIFRWTTATAPPAKFPSATEAVKLIEELIPPEALEKDIRDSLLSRLKSIASSAKYKSPEAQTGEVWGMFGALLNQAFNEPLKTEPDKPWEKDIKNLLITAVRQHLAAIKAWESQAWPAAKLKVAPPSDLKPGQHVTILDTRGYATVKVGDDGEIRSIGPDGGHFVRIRRTGVQANFLREHLEIRENDDENR